MLLVSIEYPEDKPTFYYYIETSFIIGDKSFYTNHYSNEFHVDAIYCIEWCGEEMYRKFRNPAKNIII